jgi:pimeloyl-ACP methyl ester carboxylesterase
MTARTVTVPEGRTVEVAVAEFGSGRPILLLHGGAGPGSVLGFAKLLADRHGAHVVVPTHPGFGGTARPVWLADVPQLARVYARLLEELDLHDVVVVGNSIGGWIGAELAVSQPGRVGALVLVDASGIDVPGQPVVDVFSLTLEETVKLSWHDPSKFPKSPGPPTDAERAVLVGNRAALAVYGGNPPSSDPTLRARLAGLRVPALVVWGTSDRIVAPEYGRAYAAVIPGARFELLPGAGHVPQLEAPEALHAALWSFVESTGSRGSRTPG